MPINFSVAVCTHSFAEYLLLCKNQNTMAIIYFNYGTSLIFSYYFPATLSWSFHVFIEYIDIHILHTSALVYKRLKKYLQKSFSVTLYGNITL